jgi:hypothetical protein
MDINCSPLTYKALMHIEVQRRHFGLSSASCILFSFNSGSLMHVVDCIFPHGGSVCSKWHFRSDCTLECRPHSQMRLCAMGHAFNSHNIQLQEGLVFITIRWSPSSGCDQEVPHKSGFPCYACVCFWMECYKLTSIFHASRIYNQFFL